MRSPSRLHAWLLAIILTAHGAHAQDQPPELAQGPTATAEQLAKFGRLVESHGGQVEFVPPSDPRWKDGVQGRTYLDPDGRARVLLPRDVPVRGYALLEELTHVIQLEQARGKLGPDGLKALLEGVRRGETPALNELTQWEIKAKQNILLTLPADHPDRALLRGEIEALRRLVRRPWVPVLKEQGAGLASFTLALFLKELAVVLESGDTLRMGEFFDRLVSSEFFAQYGLFALGAQSTNALYARHLQPIVLGRLRSQFVNGVLRSQLALAAGLALPQLARGELDGQRFAVDLTALGLSSLAVRGGLQGASYVTRVAGVGRYLQGAYRASHLASVPGWIFQAGETALVLYFGDKLQTAANDYLDERSVLKARDQAQERLLAAARGADEAEFAAALEAWSGTWEDLRRFQYRSLAREEARLQARLEGVAKRLGAIQEGDQRLRELAKQAPERYRSLVAPSDGLSAAQRATIESEMRDIIAAYERQLPERARAVYVDGGRLEDYGRQRAWLDKLPAGQTPERTAQLDALRRMLARQEGMDQALYREFSRTRTAELAGRGLIERLRGMPKD